MSNAISISNVDLQQDIPCIAFTALRIAHFHSCPLFLAPYFLPSRLERQQLDNKEVETRTEILGRAVSRKREEMMTGTDRIT
jgi:hypothetical protein